MALECPDGKFIESRREDNGGRLLDQLQHFESIDLRHLDVEEDKSRLVLLDRFYPFEAVIAFGGHRYLEIGLQVFFYDQSCERFVVDYDGLYHWGIFTIMVNRFVFSMRVSSRSVLANNK